MTNQPHLPSKSISTRRYASGSRKSTLRLLMLGLLGICALSACNKDDNGTDYTQYYEWRDRNNAYMDFAYRSIRTMGDAAYFTDSITSMSEPKASYPNATVYRVIRSANEDSLRRERKWYTPFYTSTLKVHYTLYKTESVLDTIAKYAPSDALMNDASVMDRIFFDSPIKADTLESYQVKFYENFTPASVVSGWGDVLQRMHIGDSWLICVPWFLGYGQGGSGSNIDPYSNLFFRLELVDITLWGGNVDETVQ